MKTALIAAAIGVSLLGCSSDDGGVFLELTATEHFDSQKVEIVLASADDANIALDVEQRLVAQSASESPVDYYRQRATGGIVATSSLDGYKVKIVPDDSVADDEQFIPIVLVHGPDGDVTAIGTIEDEDGRLRKISVRSDEPALYAMNVRPLVPMATANVHPGTTGEVHSCTRANDRKVVSGVVWNAPEEKQRRLLLPLAGETDASTLPFDLDCDDSAVEGEGAIDCDDLDPATNPNAVEACDGYDSACDGDEPFETPCQLAQETQCTRPGMTGETTMGIGICRESEDGQHSLVGEDAGCVVPPACNYPASGQGGACVVHNEIATAGGTDVRTCPAPIGSITVCTGACTVTVGPSSGDFQVKVSDTASGSFGPEATAVQGRVFLLLKDNAASHPGPGPDASFGHALLIINDDDASATTVFVVDMLLSTDHPACVTSNGHAEMGCTPP